MTGSPRGPVPGTLRGRLSLVALVAAALLVAVLTVAFNSVVRHRLQQQADDHLRTRAAAVAATVDTTGAMARVVEVPDDAALDTDVWIYAGRVRIEVPNGAAGPLAHAADALAAAGGRRCATVLAGEPVRLCGLPVGAPGRAPATVVVALGLAPYRSSADTILYASLALDAAMLACTYVLTRLAVGRALRPVGAMTDQAAAWSALASDDCFGHAPRPEELARLGRSLDTLLDRIRAGLRNERLLTRELSHELRNPLARITAEVDWWQSRPRSTAEAQRVCAVVADAARSMRTICDTLLDDARGAADDRRGTADVHRTLTEIVRRLPADGRVEAQVKTSGAEGPTAGVPQALLERAVSPLIDNAVRFARSRVELRASHRDGGIEVEVTDDGGGVPAHFTADLFQPGRRADPGDGHTGAGLGLSLARRLARSAGGDVQYDPTYGRGARFVVTLPAG
ncbi:sensor histidine kinase [Streptomyces sp. NPDC057540]|uniref:sensor histidine kinase n=1 Tax=Streptomyces sp. NPDC057540 TaxID=3346160 RepID=UPI0036CD6255